MGQPRKREQILKYKFIYTVLILLVYTIGKGIPLYMVDLSAYLNKTVDAEGLLMQTINGDIYQCSVFALGISPYMIANIFNMIMSAFRKPETKAKMSQVKNNRITLAIMFVIAIVQAILTTRELQFRVEGQMLVVAQIIAAIEMIAGAFVIMWLCSRNKRFGIGGQSALIYINILDGIKNTITAQELEHLTIPLAISAVVILVMIIMENTEFRIPVLRISIHNIYADKNYMAIKLNPIGVMPAMFSMAIFMLPQMVIGLLVWIDPTHIELLEWQDKLSLNHPMGIVLYIIVLYGLTLGFSRVFINPKEITENFIKSGDCLLGIHAGKDTKRYLSRVITRLGLLSATVMTICLGGPILLQYYGYIENGLSTLPSSIMMMTGIWCNLHREVQAYKDLEMYEPFI